MNRDLNKTYSQMMATRNLFNGTSFRMSEGTDNTFYANDEQNIDFISYKGCFLYCLTSHGSSPSNVPVPLYNDTGVATGIAPNQYGSFIFGGVNQFVDGVPVLKPLFRIRNAKWEISYDQGSSGEIIGKATEVLDVGTFSIDDNGNLIYEDVNGQYNLGCVVGNDGINGKDGKDGKDGNDGKDGKDGGEGHGFDYIFTLTTTPQLPESIDPSRLSAIQQDNYTPEKGSRTLQQVSETNEYQGVSTREKIHGEGTQFSSPVIYNTYVMDGISPEVSFTSFIFTRTNKIGNATDQPPKGGSYDHPYPTSNGTIGNTDVTGFDSVPAGNELVWMSTCTFNNQTDTNAVYQWSEPRQISDTSNFQIEFSQQTIYTQPTSLQIYYDADPINYEDNWHIDNSSGSDDGTNAIGMATSVMHNGVGSDWAISKIKGENGNDGTPINVVGEVDTFDSLPECFSYTGNPGDAFVVKSYESESNVLFVYKGDNDTCGIYVGPINAQGAFIHIKYATVLYSEDQLVDGEWPYWSGSNGEIPNDFIGIYWDSNPNDSLHPKDYTWTRGRGEDGGNYQYIYTTTIDYNAPQVPNISENNDLYIPEGGYDDPVDVSKDAPYCGMCYRHKENGTGGQYYGSNTNSGYAALGAKGGQDGLNGQDGASVEYVFAQSSVDSIVFDESGIDILPSDDGEYDTPRLPWTDDAKGVSSSAPVEWMCMRIKPAGATTGNKGSTPSVFSHYGHDGESGEDGSPGVNGADGITSMTISLYSTQALEPTGVVWDTYDYENQKLYYLGEEVTVTPGSGNVPSTEETIYKCDGVLTGVIQDNYLKNKDKHLIENYPNTYEILIEGELPEYTTITRQLFLPIGPWVSTEEVRILYSDVSSIDSRTSETDLINRYNFTTTPKHGDNLYGAYNPGATEAGDGQVIPCYEGSRSYYNSIPQNGKDARFYSVELTETESSKGTGVLQVAEVQAISGGALAQFKEYNELLMSTGTRYYSTTITEKLVLYESDGKIYYRTSLPLKDKSFYGEVIKHRAFDGILGGIPYVYVPSISEALNSVEYLTAAFGQDNINNDYAVTLGKVIAVTDDVNNVVAGISNGSEISNGESSVTPPMIFAGADNIQNCNTAKFMVSNDGAVTASDIQIIGGAIKLNEEYAGGESTNAIQVGDNFFVQYDGAVVASKLTATGYISFPTISLSLLKPSNPSGHIISITDSDTTYHVIDFSRFDSNDIIIRESNLDNNNTIGLPSLYNGTLPVGRQNSLIGMLKDNNAFSNAKECYYRLRKYGIIKITVFGEVVFKGTNNTSDDHEISVVGDENGNSVYFIISPSNPFIVTDNDGNITNKYGYGQGLNYSVLTI